MGLLKHTLELKDGTIGETEMDDFDFLSWNALERERERERGGPWLDQTIQSKFLFLFLFLFLKFKVSFLWLIKKKKKYVDHTYI